MKNSNLFLFSLPFRAIGWCVYTVAVIVHLTAIVCLFAGIFAPALLVLFVIGLALAYLLMEIAKCFGVDPDAKSDPGPAHG